MACNCKYVRKFNTGLLCNIYTIYIHCERERKSKEERDREREREREKEKGDVKIAVRGKKI